MAKSPAVILFDSSGVAMAVANGVAIPVGTQAILAAGSDGTDARFVLVDANGRPVMVGAGVAGTPAGGVLSIQGVAGGTAVPVSGTISATNPSVGTNNAAVPSSSTQVGGTDGTNLQSAHVFDSDTGGGTQYILGVGLRKAASGGSVEAGTSSDPLRVDPTGTTTQPISAASLPLPSGAATESTLATRLADATFTARINTLGQKTMANSTPVVLASDQTVIPVSDNGGSLTVDGTVTANIGTTNGLALDATLTGGTARTKITDGTNNAAVKAASTAAVAGDPALVVAISPNNTITTSNASVGSNNAAIPTSSTEIGGSDGTNLQAVRVFDGDTGAGTQYVLGSILRKSASGGTVEAGTSSDPLRVDPTGTTTQPVSAASLPLPTGAATEATLATRLADATFTARINTLGQKTSANSTPVVLASDQSAIPITDNAGSLTVDGTVTSNQGTAAALSGRWPVQVTDGTNTMPTGDTVGRALFEKITDGTNTAAVKAASTAAVAGDPALVVAISPNNTITTSNASVGANGSAIPASSTEIGGSDGTNLQAIRVFDGDTGAGTQYVLGAVLRKSASGGSVEAGTSSDPLRMDPTGTTAQPVTDNAGSLTVDSTQLPSALVGGRLDENVGAWLGSTAPTVGSKTSANSVPVVIASDQAAVPVSGTVTANIGTSGSLALDATLTGGTQKAVVRGGAKGATTAADVTSTAEGTDHQALDIQIYHGGTAKDPTQIRALTSADVVTAVQGTAAALAGYWPVRVTDGTNTMPTADTVARSSFHRVTDGTNTAAVKAASTAAVAGDPALVVAISPNNTITTSNASVGSNGSAIPTSSTEIGGSDGTNLQAIRVFDADTGAGTQYVLGAVLRKSASGGSVEAGTSADPLRIDPTGTTTQPISAASLPLPTGASTSANQTTLGNQTTKINDGTNTSGVKAASTAAVAADPALVVAISPNTAPIIQVTGAHANAWNAVSVGAGGISNVVDCQFVSHITVFGNSSGNTTISYQVSQDNTNFYTAATFTTGSGNFGADFTTGARYIRLQSGTARTITATISGKA